MLGELQTDLNLLLRLVVALVLAGALGWERESTNKDAGLRTHMLVGMASALFMILGEAMIDRYRDSSRQGVQVDMTRVLSAVATGISFLGAGTVFVNRDRVQGLTTAASILATAAVGIAAGLERYGLAVGSTLLLLLVLRTMRVVKREINPEERGERGS